MDAGRRGDRDVTLVIGFGNTLRSDDGVGPRVAAAVAAWDLPNVEAIAVHQLTPELAARLAQARMVVFVDARPGAEADAYEVHPISAAPVSQAAGHTCDPRSLLNLARQAYGRHPSAWLVTVPATNLLFGERLSPTAERESKAALRQIALVLTRSIQRADELAPSAAEAACLSLT
jgi:hydrogenase maturation protease